MIRVVLPAHLRALARIDGEVHLVITGPVTQRSVLDALEARYPMLRGTIRGHAALGVPSSGSSPASWTCPTTRPTTRCPMLSPPGPSPISSSAPWQEDKSAGQPASARTRTGIGRSDGPGLRK